MILQMERSLENLAADIRRVDKSYTSYKARNYLSFRHSYRRFLDRIEPVNSVLIAALFLCVAFIVEFVRHFLRKQEKRHEP